MDLTKEETITLHEDDQLLETFCLERNLTKSTFNGYRSALKDYTTYNQMNLKSLLEEAYLEEDARIPKRERKIKKRLMDFRGYLINKHNSGGVKTYFAKVKTFYRHYEIEIPDLPNLKLKKGYVTNYDDIPKHEHIRNAIMYSDNDIKTLILFMATSGTAKAETLSLTVNDFIKATKDYHNNNGLSNILNSLEKRDDVVPTWYLKRIKTDKYYYTFNHPQATKAIVDYLKSRLNNSVLDPDDKIFPFLPSLVLDRFQKINDHFEWGRKGKYRFFRSHTLRKFHASNIGLPAEQIDALQGRSKNVVHETYIKTNPEELKKVYMGAMHRVAINLGEGDMIDGVELLKKKKEIEKISESKNNAKPVFSEDGNFQGEIESPDGKKNLGETIQERKETVEKEVEPKLKQKRNPIKESKKALIPEPEPEIKEEPKKCPKCGDIVFNTFQGLCTKCKEETFKEIWEENLLPLLHEKTFFTFKDVNQVDFPVSYENSMKWYIKQGYIVKRMTGVGRNSINEYYLPEDYQIKINNSVQKRLKTLIISDMVKSNEEDEPLSLHLDLLKQIEESN